MIWYEQYKTTRLINLKLDSEPRNDKDNTIGQRTTEVFIEIYRKSGTCTVAYYYERDTIYRSIIIGYTNIWLFLSEIM